DLVHQPPPLRLVGWHRQTGEQHAHGDLERQLADEAVDAAIRSGEADTWLRQAKPGVLRRDNDVAREGELTAAAYGDAVHRRDDRLDHAEPLGQSTKAAGFVREPVWPRRRFVLTVLQVCSGAECLVTVAGDDGHPRVVVLLEAAPGGVHLEV